MGGESSSSSSLDSSDTEMGSQKELINIRGSQLYLIDGEESVLMQRGEFSLKLLKQTHSPLAVVVANVGEVQWPIGKDAPVLKVFHRRYTFALPGLVYGMILPDSTPAMVIQQLEAILAEYSTFETHHEIAKAVQSQFASGGRDNAGYWTAVAPEVETLSSRVARQIDSTSTIVASSIVIGGDWAALGIKHGGSLLKRKGPDSPPGVSGDDGVSPRMMKRMQQARRMSAVAKLISRTLLKGAISTEAHVSKTLGLDVNTPSSGPIYTPQNVDSARNVAVASVDAFGKVVEAVETAGKSLYDATQKVGTDIVQERFGHQAGQVLQDGLGAVGNVINTAWTLNKMGVKMLLRMTAASTALSTRSSGSKSKDQDQGMSSPNSTGATPMKHRSPPHLQHQVTLSPQQSAESVPLNLLPNTSLQSGQQLQTSQLFPTSAEQMRNQAVVGLPAPSPLFMPPGNFTAIIPPGPRPNSPFQQYHRLPSQQSSQHSAPSSFTFQPRANTHME